MTDPVTYLGSYAAILFGVTAFSKLTAPTSYDEAIRSSRYFAMDARFYHVTFAMRQNTEMSAAILNWIYSHQHLFKKDFLQNTFSISSNGEHVYTFGIPKYNTPLLLKTYHGDISLTCGSVDGIHLSFFTLATRKRLWGLFRKRKYNHQRLFEFIKNEIIEGTDIIYSECAYKSTKYSDVLAKKLEKRKKVWIKKNRDESFFGPRVPIDVILKMNRWIETLEPDLKNLFIKGLEDRKTSVEVYIKQFISTNCQNS